MILARKRRLSCSSTGLREIGALTSSLGGLDGLVFTVGIGEHAPEIRARACARLGWLAVALDGEVNQRNATLISTPDSGVVLHVIPTDEEAMIVRHTLDIAGGAAANSRAAGADGRGGAGAGRRRNRFSR